MISKGTIVYIGGFELPDKNAAAHRVINNAKIFYKLGYEIVFCGIDKSISKNSIEPINGPFYKSYPIKYPKTAIQWARYLLTFKHIKTVLSAISNLKFVICYNMHAIPFSKTIAFCKKKKISVIIDVTEWYENKFSLVPNKFFKFLDTEIVMKKLNKKVDGAIVISKFLENYYSKTLKAIILIPPLVDISEDIWNQKRETSDRISFIFNGIPEKGKEDLELSVSCFFDIEGDYQLKMLGITKEDFCNEFPALKSKVYNSSEKIFFYGVVSHNDSIKLLLESDYCFILRRQSRKNNAGFSTKFVEAITTGTFVIATNTGDVAEYTNQGNVIVLNEIDKTKIQECITNCIMRNIKCSHVFNNCFDYQNYISSVDYFLKSIKNKGLKK